MKENFVVTYYVSVLTKGVLIFAIAMSLYACERAKPETKAAPVVSNKPVVTENGQLIAFHRQQPTFLVTPVRRNLLSGTYDAPAIAVASILTPSRAEAIAIILFDDPELNQLYSSYQQSLTHYARDTEFLVRTRDMFEHKAATGRELREAETGLAEAATELAEKEGRFRMLGFSPEDLRRARPGYAWLLADVPETIIENLEKKDKVSVSFSSYPAETFLGQITAIGDVVDNSTRTVKVRITLPNKDGKIKPGMYAKVNISLQVNNTLSVPATALVAVQARNYVFVKKGNTYRRTEVVTGQQIGNNVLVLKGLQESDSVLYQGTMLMKGISFGF